MKGIRGARPQRRLALVVLLAAAVLAVTVFPFRESFWGGLILAVAEAGVVGGLADWFAVTALFRRPLGLPIPHTDLISTNWELMAARVGTMVGDRVLTTEYVTREISRLDVAELLSRASERIQPADLEVAVRVVARWAAAEVPPESAAELASWLQRRLREQPLAPVLADILEAALRQGREQQAVQALADALAGAFDRPDFLGAVGDLVEAVVKSYRKRTLLIRLADRLGLLGRDRLVVALHGAVAKLAEDAEHPLRQRLSAALAVLPSRLRTEPELAARVEAGKAALLDSPAITHLVEHAARRLHEVLAADLVGDRSQVVAWITGQLERARATLVTDAELRGKLDHWVKAHAVKLVEDHQSRIAVFIERGVRALGAEGAVRLIEEHVGDDLQYIRVNGTVVGGLAGGAIYGVHRLLLGIGW